MSYREALARKLLPGRIVPDVPPNQRASWYLHSAADLIEPDVAPVDDCPAARMERSKRCGALVDRMLTAIERKPA